MTPEGSERHAKTAVVETVGHDGTGVSIPSDDDSPFVLEFLLQHTDVRSFKISDKTAKVYLRHLRFTGHFGGGPLPMIAEELSLIAGAIKNNKDRRGC